MSRRRPVRTPGASPHRDAPYWIHSPPLEDDAPDVAPSTGEDPCPGPCNRAFRAAEQAAADHDTPMYPGRPVWCRDVARTNERGEILGVTHHGCTERIQQDLAALLDLASTLTPGPLNTPRDAKVDDRPNGSAKSLAFAPSPSPGWDELDDLIRWAVTLEDRLRSRLGMPLPRQPRRALTGEEHRTLSAAHRFLTAYSTALLSGPDAGQVGRDIMGRHRRLTAGTGADRLVHRVDGLCLRCDAKSLERKDGGDLVQCRACRATWEWGQFEFLARAYAEDVRKTGA